MNVVWWERAKRPQGLFARVLYVRTCVCCCYKRKRLTSSISQDDYEQVRHGVVCEPIRAAVYSSPDNTCGYYCKSYINLLLGGWVHTTRRAPQARQNGSLPLPIPCPFFLKRLQLLLKPLMPPNMYETPAVPFSFITPVQVCAWCAGNAFCCRAAACMYGKQVVSTRSRQDTTTAPGAIDRCFSSPAATLSVVGGAIRCRGRSWSGC